MTRPQDQPHHRLRAALQSLSWTMAILAEVTGNSPSTVRRWCNGRYDVPAPLLAWIEGCAEYMETHSPPPRPERW